MVMVIHTGFYRSLYSDGSRRRSLYNHIFTTLHSWNEICTKMDWSKGIGGLNGGLAVGSVIWGIIANTMGIPITLSMASLALAATIITRKRYRINVVDDLDFTPAGSDYWLQPQQLSIDPLNSKGQ